MPKSSCDGQEWQEVCLPYFVSNHFSDPYININFDNYEKIKVPKKKKTLNPVWEKFNKTFMYPTKHLRGLKKKKMVLEVVDHDVVGADDFIGSVAVDLHTLATGSIKHVLTLFTKQHTKAGEIEFQFVMKHITSIKVTMNETSARDLVGAKSKNKYFMKMEPISSVEYKSEETASAQGPSPSWSQPHSLMFESISLSKFKREGVSLRLYRKKKLKSLSKLIGTCSVEFDLYLKKRDFDEVTVEKELRNNDGEKVGLIRFKMDFHHLPRYSQLLGGLHSDTDSVGRRLLLDSDVPRNYKESHPVANVNATAGGQKLFQQQHQQQQQQPQQANMYIPGSGKQQQQQQQQSGNMYIPGSGKRSSGRPNLNVGMNLPQFATQQQQKRPVSPQTQAQKAPVNKFMQYYQHQQAQSMNRRHSGPKSYTQQTQQQQQQMTMPQQNQNKFMQMAYAQQRQKMLLQQQQQQQQQQRVMGSQSMMQPAHGFNNKFTRYAQQKGMYNLGGSSTTKMPVQQKQMPNVDRSGFVMPKSMNSGMPMGMPQQQQQHTMPMNNKFMQYAMPMQQQPMKMPMQMQQQQRTSMPPQRSQSMATPGNYNPFLQQQAKKKNPMMQNVVQQQQQHNQRVNSMPQMNVNQFQQMYQQRQMQMPQQQQQQMPQQQGQQGGMNYNKFMQFQK